MKRTIVTTLLLGFIFAACNQGTRPSNNTTSKASTDSSADKQEISRLVRQMLNWKESKGFYLTPAEENKADSTYIGLDLTKHEQNIKTLMESGFFAQEFINNYDKLIRTIDKKLRNGEFDKWHEGELPTFRFANDVDPWCDCQDVPYDNPNPWDLVEITFKDLNDEKATLTWTWGRSEWSKDFAYTVKTVKEDGKWKIAYLQDFDFEEGTKKDGL